MGTSAIGYFSRRYDIPAASADCGSRSRTRLMARIAGGRPTTLCDRELVATAAENEDDPASCAGHFMHRFVPTKRAGYDQCDSGARKRSSPATGRASRAPAIRKKGKLRGIGTPCVEIPARHVSQ